jgi:hypothetical protein
VTRAAVKRLYVLASYAVCAWFALQLLDQYLLVVLALLRVMESSTTSATTGSQLQQEQFN